MTSRLYAGGVTVVIQSSYSPSHPNTEMVQRAVASLTGLGTELEFLFVYDGFNGNDERRNDYDRYRQQMKSLLPGRHFESASWRQSGLCLKDAFSLVETDYVLYWEHDWELIRKVPLLDLVRCLKECSDVKMIRLNKRNTRAIGFDYEIAERKGPSRVPLVRTTALSCNPHLTTTGFYRQHALPYVRAGEALEQTLVSTANDRYKLSSMRDRYPVFGCCLYGKIDAPPVVKHLDGKNYN